MARVQVVFEITFDFSDLILNNNDTGSFSLHLLAFVFQVGW